MWLTQQPAVLTFFFFLANKLKKCNQLSYQSQLTIAKYPHLVAFRMHFILKILREGFPKNAFAEEKYTVSKAFSDSVRDQRYKCSFH